MHSVIGIMSACEGRFPRDVLSDENVCYSSSRGPLLVTGVGCVVAVVETVVPFYCVLIRCGSRLRCQRCEIALLVRLPPGK